MAGPCECVDPPFGSFVTEERWLRRDCAGVLVASSTSSTKLFRMASAEFHISI
jgi:hypothetical protein